MVNKGFNNPKNKLSRVVRNDKIFELYLSGMKPRIISEQEGIDIGERAIQIVIQKGIEKIGTENLQEIKKVEIAKLDKLERELNESGKKGDWKTANALLKVAERRAKLQGLDYNDSRRADAAMISATAQATQAQDFVRLLDSVLDELGIGFEQRRRVPSIIVQKLQVLGLTDGIKGVKELEK